MKLLKKIFLNSYFFILICFYKLRTSNNENSDVQHCSNGRGVSVFDVNIHCDTAALIKLRTSLSREFSMDFNSMTAALKFFGAILDMINEDLQKYGVQLRGKFTNLRTESLGTLPYNQRKCEKENAVRTRTALMGNFLRLKKLGSIGNRLIIFYCRDLKDGKDSSRMSFGKCGNITGVAMGNLRNLVNTIKRELVRSIFRNQYQIDEKTVNTFNSSLCDQVRSCIPKSGKGDLYGEFISDLKSIRHLAAENYISGNHYRIREHDLYDDVEDWRGEDEPHEGDIYPTQDYSNDNELYEDTEKQKKKIPFL